MKWSTRRVFRHPGLWLALAAYLLLASFYFFIVPIFEGPDEWTHTGHVKYIAQGNGLPVMLPGRGIWGGQQPPLYYAVGAVLVQPFTLAGVDDYEENRRNPHASLGYALDPGNKNNYLHSPDEAFPYRGLALTVHVLRLYSMVYGVIALIFTYLTALEIYSIRFTNDDPESTRCLSSNSVCPHPQPLPRKTGKGGRGDGAEIILRKDTKPQTISQPHLFASAVALFMACQPMFAFITASVANEPANIAFSAVGLWLAQRYVLRGPGRGWGRAVALGVTLGLIALAKMTGLSFGLVAVTAMLITAVAARKTPGAARLLWRDGLIMGLLFVAVAGWWYGRNYVLYGDFFQQGLYKLYFNVDPQSISLNQFLYTLSTGEVSFWATFGWLNIVAPEWVYSLYRVVSRVGLVGAGAAIAVQAFRRTDDTTRPMPALILHLLFPATLAFSLLRLVATEGGLQGRQLLPALGSVAIVVMWGWFTLTPARWRLPVLGLLLAALFGLAAWLPFGVAAPAYIPRPFIAEATLPADLPRLNWTYNDEMELIGVKIGADVVRPGERVPVTAYWRALKPIAVNYSVFVHLVGRDYSTVGQMNTYPGLGLRPTTTLLPGQIFADTYPVQVNGGSVAPTRLRVNMGLFNFNQPGRPGIIPNDAPGAPTAGQLKLIPAQWPAVESGPPQAKFDDAISLTQTAVQGCEAAAGPCEITFTWLAQGRLAADYTVFIQLWSNGQFAAGFDSPPLNNDYPTSLWEAGEVIVDPHRLDLTAVPPGQYRLVAGLYNFATGQRLPAYANIVPLPDFAVDLGRLEIR